MYLKIHKTKNGKIIAACDAELVGTVLEEGRLCLDLKAHKDFYVGKKANERELIAALRDFSSVNLVGKKVVEIAAKTGIVEEKYIKYIKGIPYIQIYKI
jgi:hypothetical protein